MDDIDECFQYLHDSETIQRELVADKERVFSADRLNISVWPKCQDPSRHFEEITENCLLDDWIDAVLLAPKNAFLILKQRYTFGPILISLESFQRLLNLCQIFLPFISCIRAFGSKGSDVQYGGCHRKIARNSIEICYNIHYPALRERRSKQPWSIRQMAAYQHYNLETKISRWIFVQPSGVVELRLNSILKSERILDMNPILPHLILLQSAEKDWEGFLKYWKEEYEAKKNIARYERLGTTGRAGVQISFNDIQRLEYIRYELSTCAAIIASSLDTAKDCIEFCERHDGEPALKEAMRTKFALYIRRMESHARTTELLLEHAKDTAKLLSQIIDIRNEEASIQSNHNLRDLLSILTEIGTSSRKESERVLKLSEQAQKDSRFTIFLAFVAMLYLPASLVATVFSSNLLQLISKGETAGETSFVPSTQFWIFPVATIVLAFFTVAPVILFRKYQAGNIFSKTPKVHIA